MKRCPQCNRVETDEALKFCRVDGATLVSDSSAIGDAGTVGLTSAPFASEVHTSILQNNTSANVGSGFTYISTRAGVSNIWLQPIDGGQPRQLTDFKTDLIFSFAWSRDGKRLACSRGTEDRDVILINFQ